MIRLIHFFVRQKLFINLLVVLVFLAGGYILARMNREAFPNVNFDRVSIQTLYPGASPDEIEQLISIPIEKELREIAGLKKVKSYNLENISVFVIEIEPDISDEQKRKTIDDIKDAVDTVRGDLPAGAEQPIVEEITFDTQPALDIAITIDSDRQNPEEQYRELRRTARDLEDYLYDSSGVAEVERFGYLDREYRVEVRPEALQRYRVGFNSIANAIRDRNFDLPGGVLRLGADEYLLRTKEQYRNINEVRNTVVRANLGGGGLRVRDVGSVYDTFEEAKILERFNGQNAIILKIWKKNDADMLTLTDEVKRRLAEFENRIDTDRITIEYFNDYSRFVRVRLSSLIINGIIGFVLLGLTMFIILGPRMSFIVGMSIPTAFMVAFIGMSVFDITLNVVSMFALVMVLGMIVDFSIVVAENGFRHMEEGEERVTAVEVGTSEVFWPVTTTLLCITAAFFPLLHMTGIVGKFVWSIPMVIILCLVASWLAAMFVVPSHLETFGRVQDADRVEGRSKNGRRFDPFGVLQKIYMRMLRWCLIHRYITLGILVATFISTLALSAALLGFVFFPGGGGEGILIRTKMPQGTNLQANLNAIRSVEAIASSLPPEEVESIHTRVGVELANPTDPAPSEGTHRGTLILHLTPDGTRDRDATAMVDDLRNRAADARAAGKLSPDLNLDFRVQEGGPPRGLPVNVEIRGAEISVLRQIAAEYMEYLKTVDGVYDISTDLEPGKREYRFRVNELRAAQADTSVLEIARTIRAAFDGTVASQVHEGEDEIEVRVRFPDEARRNLATLNEVSIENKNGFLVPLASVTAWEQEEGYALINRLNFKRVGQVQANIDDTVTTSVAVNALLAKKFQDIESRYPGYSINYGGEEEERQESLSNLMVLFLFAMITIYMILASFFRSLITPIIVMSAIPFGLVGVILALMAHLQPLSFMSLLGVVSLTGVIVSNTLVLVEFINITRKEGLSLLETLVRVGSLRFRPVILTSATTVLGLLPTVYGIGGQDAFVQPLALAFGYGLIFATFITLVLIPCLYYIVEDMKAKVRGVLARIQS